jgi:cell division ATPase FtsA
MRSNGERCGVRDPIGHEGVSLEIDMMSVHLQEIKRIGRSG